MAGVGDLLGLPLGEASDRVRAAGRPAPAVIRSEPPRARHAHPPDEAWRVVRVRDLPAGLELVVAPPIAGPAVAAPEDPAC